MSAPDPTAARPWLRWTLLVSLALNVALLVALGLHLAGWRHPHPVPADLSPHLLHGPWQEQLSPEARSALRTALATHGPAIGRAWRGVRQARREVGRELRADAPDPPQLRDALASLRAAESARAEAVHALLAEAMKDLELRQRRELARALLHRHPMGPAGTGGRHRQAADRAAQDADSED